MNDWLRYAAFTAGIALVTGASIASAKHMAPVPVKIPVDLEDQSVEVPNSGGARQSRLAPLGGFSDFIYDDAKTLFQVMKSGHRISGNGPCLGYRGDKPEYKWLTYGDVLERSRNLGSGLVNIGMKPGQSSFVGIYSKNRVEWILTEQAVYSQSAVIVALYDTLGPNACSFIINQADIEIVFCDTVSKVESLLSCKDGVPRLKHIIVMQEVSDDLKVAAKNKGVELHYIRDIEDLGKKNPVRLLEPKPSDIATVCYTSGTTGNPKGVILTHANIVLDVCSAILHMNIHAPTKDDVTLSILPLAHMFERCSVLYLFMNGGRVGFSRGDVQLLMEDLKTLKPTIVTLVPRLFNKVYDKAMATIKESRIKSFLFQLALRSKQAEIEKLIIRKDSIWDRFVFKALQEAFGGRVKFLSCGSAPIAGHVLTFMRCALGCIIVEGFGQTEGVAPCTSNFPAEFGTGHVGVPLPCCHIKLVDVPEMEYFSRSNQGEICIKGLNVFQGYLKEPKSTAEVIDADGWLHTGDIGMWLPNGALKVVDRKKNIFKLAQGEYIVPEKIENIYGLSTYVAQVFVHGESLKSCLVAIVVPEQETVTQWCKKKVITDNWDKICKNKEVKQLILQDLQRLGKNGGLHSFEQVKDIYLQPQPFTLEDGLLTPTMKTKRVECKKRFQHVINDMYRKMP